MRGIYLGHFIKQWAYLFNKVSMYTCLWAFTPLAQELWPGTEHG